MKPKKPKDIKNQILLGDSTQIIKQFPDKSFTAIITDPPYEYLNHQLDKKISNKPDFAKELFRILDDNGFLIWFGKGISFYQWNTIFNEIGFKFKEEIIWDKSYTSSPVTNIMRKHETISIWTKGKGKINKVLIPYEKTHKKRFMIYDMLRVLQAFRTEKEYVVHFLQNGNIPFQNKNKKLKHFITCGSPDAKPMKLYNAGANAVKKLTNGFIETSIIQEPSYLETYLNLEKIFDHERIYTLLKNSIQQKNINIEKLVNLEKILNFFFNDKSFNTELCKENTFIEATREHYKALHPTQKPVDLMIRLIQLIKSPENNLILDPFAGSGSTLVACKLLGINFVGIEINPEYHKIATKRLNQNPDESFLLEILNPNQKENIKDKNPQNIESYVKKLSNLFQKIYLSLLLNNKTNNSDNDEINNSKLYSLTYAPPVNKKPKTQNSQLNLL